MAQNKVKMEKFFACGSHKGKGLAVFTSGGDSQGMNATVRAAVRMALFVGCKAYLILEGYHGMIDGGNNIVEANWFSVSSIIQRGGTFIGSARCSEFVHRRGRLVAAKNLVDRGITNLVVIGGDGSLTGANVFRQEWSSLLEELFNDSQITEEQKRKHSVLHIAGIVGSIDNDFCGTDLTIGTDSALHRIIEAIDAIVSTASSQQRVYIMEVMGRYCGYLSVVTGIISEADYVFCPESPPPEDWREQLCEKLRQGRCGGKRLHIIIVAEGAVDREGNCISAEDIQHLLIDKLQLQPHITVLGHVQRGGNTSAIDRILGCRMGAEATLALMEATPKTVPVVICLDGNQIVRLPLMECVQRTEAVAQAMKTKNWELAVQLRGPLFKVYLETYQMLSHLKPPEYSGRGYRLAVMHIGNPACGMNAAVHSFVRSCIYRGYTVYGIRDSISGLIAGNIKEMQWTDVDGWVGQGGAILGTRHIRQEINFKEIAARIKEFNIQALLIIGGFEAYVSCIQLADNRSEYPEFCIPLAVIPSTISNNVPGTVFSLGSDTSLNEIIDICDRMRQSAQGTKKRVFVVETMGRYCGYLATLAGMAGGADAAYIFEEKFTVTDLERDVVHMVSKMAEGVQRGLVLRSERASDNYDTDFIHRLFAEECQGYFTCRKNILGHNQEGGFPSPFDRSMATTMGVKCVQWFSEQFQAHKQPDGTIKCTNKESAILLGMYRRKFQFTPVADLIDGTDFKHSIPKCQWWLRLRPLLKVLAKHESAHEEVGRYTIIEQDCFPDNIP